MGWLIRVAQTKVTSVDVWISYRRGRGSIVVCSSTSITSRLIYSTRVLCYPSEEEKFQRRSTGERGVTSHIKQYESIDILEVL